MKNINARQNSNGFTIVELLLVIVVIAILAAISIVAYNGVQTRAKVSQKETEVGQIEKKLEIYKQIYGSDGNEYNRPDYGNAWGSYDYGAGAYTGPDIGYYQKLDLGNSLAKKSVNCVEIEGVEYTSCARMSDGSLIEREDITADMYVVQPVYGYAIYYYDDMKKSWTARATDTYLEPYGALGHPEYLSSNYPW